MRLKIMSLNCWLVPEPFAIHNHQRLIRLVELIKKYDPDIVALQEVWLKKYIRYLKRKLPGFYFTFSNTTIFNKTGLITLSKFKPKSNKISFFELSLNHNAIEILGRKGYILTTFDISGKKFSLVNTHLYTPFFHSGRSISRKQFDFFKKIKQKNVIIAGDFNLEKNDVLKISKGMKQLCNHEHTVCNTNPYAATLFNSAQFKDNRKLDYIMLKNGKMHMASKVLKRPLVSDHYAIYGTITF